MERVRNGRMYVVGLLRTGADEEGRERLTAAEDAGRTRTILS